MLNKEQKEAVSCNDKRILCLAGAGTGKTYTMLERIHRLIQDGVSSDCILALTFTHAAASEMEDRFKSTSNNDVPKFCTFHSFCYSLIISDKSVRKKVGYERIPWIAEDYQIRKIEEDAKKQTGIKLSDKKIHENSSNLTMKETKDLEILRSAEDRLMKMKNLITFDHLCYDVCELFKKKDDSIKEYLNKYEYIFVDEFQDTDKKQYEFVKSFEGAKIFVVGDALQNLYSFRGADSSIIKSLAEDKDWTTIKLFQNYRSTEPICNFANEMSHYAKDTFRIAIESHRYGEDVHTQYMSANSRYSIYDEDCLKLCKDANSWKGKTAILCRTNAEVKSIQKMYTENGLTYSLGSNADIGLHVIEYSNKENLDDSVNWLSSFLSDREYPTFLTKCQEYDVKSQKFPFDKFMKIFYRNKTISKYEKLMTKVKEELDSNDDMKSKWYSIFEEISVKPKGFPEGIENNSDLVNNIKCALSGTGMIEDDSVYIGTVHSVKGLEFDNVILVGVGGKSFPLSSEENKNVYYVGITRAKSKLYVLEAE